MVLSGLHIHVHVCTHVNHNYIHYRVHVHDVLWAWAAIPVLNSGCGRQVWLIIISCTCKECHVHLQLNQRLKPQDWQQWQINHFTLTHVHGDSQCPPFSLVSCPDSLSHTEKESGETRIQFWFSLNVRDVLWRSHNSPLHACIIIRVRTAELLASPKL